MSVYLPESSGTITVIAGCMFSGKTTLLIEKLKFHQAQGRSIVAIKPEIDTRTHLSELHTHNRDTFKAQVVAHSSQIIAISESVDVVGIDEAQFFDNSLPDIVTQLANKNKMVYIAGLDLDAKGKPFGPMPYLLALAENAIKLKAVCAITGDPATFTYRKTNQTEQILVGAQEIYEARNRKSFFNL